MGDAMSYPFLTPDGAEFVHSEMSDDRVRVDMEHPDAALCFKTASR
jgi:hypothetical protein